MLCSGNIYCCQGCCCSTRSWPQQVATAERRSGWNLPRRTGAALTIVFGVFGSQSVLAGPAPTQPAVAPLLYKRRRQSPTKALRAEQLKLFQIQVAPTLSAEVRRASLAPLPSRQLLRRSLRIPPSTLLGGAAGSRPPRPRARESRTAAAPARGCPPCASYSACRPRSCCRQGNRSSWHGRRGWGIHSTSAPLHNYERRREEDSPSSSAPGIRQAAIQRNKVIEEHLQHSRQRPIRLVDSAAQQV